MVGGARARGSGDAVHRRDRSMVRQVEAWRAARIAWVVHFVRDDGGRAVFARGGGVTRRARRLNAGEHLGV